MSTGVIFDLDETLIDRRASLTIYAANLWRGNSEGMQLSESAFTDLFHEIDDKARTPRAEFFAAIAAQALPNYTASQFEEHFYSQAWLAPVLIEGCVSLLQTLRLKGFRLGILSNGGARAQLAKIRNTGLDTLVDSYLISEIFGVKKPHPDIYAEMIRLLDIRPEDSWFVGDCPVADVMGATRAGLQAIWIERYTPWPNEHEPCYVARTTRLADVAQIIL